MSVNPFVQAGRLREVQASVANPINSGLKFVVNFASQNGKFDKGLDKMLTKKWSRVNSDYKTVYAIQTNCKLGFLVESPVASDIWVLSLIVRDKNDALDEKGLQTAMTTLSKKALYEKASVHFDKQLFGDMPTLADLVQKHLLDVGVNVYVYDAKPVA